MFNSPIKANLNVDATHALNTVTEGITGGAGKLFDFLFLERKARAQAKASHIETQAYINNELIKHGLAKYENGQIQYTYKYDKAVLYLNYIKNREIDNILSCVNEAENELEDEEIQSAKDKIDEDFLEEWQYIARRKSTKYAQKLWGRILKTEILKQNSISIRSLHVLKNMSKDEAEIFTRVAKYRVNNMILNDNNLISSYEIQKLNDAGIFASSITLTNENNINKNFIALKGARWGFCIFFRDDAQQTNYSFKISGALLTPTGEQLMNIPDISLINESELKIIFNILKKQNNFIKSISVHPIINDNTFNNQIIFCSYSE